MVMKGEELAKLKLKSTFDDDTNEWTIPVFLLKAREVALPSLSIKKQAQEFMENQKNERMLVYADEESEDSNANLKSQAHRNGNNYMAQYEAAH